MAVSTKRIVVLGKTGAGKSSLANTLFGEKLFEPNHSAKSGTTECVAKSKSVRGREIMWIDTPGFFDTRRSEEEMKDEIVRCITECAPGPHVFLIVLKVEKYTEQEQDVIKKINQYFSEEALKFTTILFTHGDQLEGGMKIEEFVKESEDLYDLIKKCGNRCHAIDNKYWKNPQDEYRSNQVQVEALLNTIDKMIEENKGRCYTNEMLQAVQRRIQEEERRTASGENKIEEEMLEGKHREIQEQSDHICQSSPNIPPDEIMLRAKTAVFKNLTHEAVKLTTGSLLMAFLGGKDKTEFV